MNRLWRPSLLPFFAFALLLVPRAGSAATINIFIEPEKLYQNSTNNPCVFYGTKDGAENKCNKTPPDWYPVVGPTGSDGSGALRTLENTFADLDAFYDVFPNGQFVVGFDVNETNEAQPLFYFHILFYNALDVQIGSYDYVSPNVATTGTLLPASSNGNGWADYILAAGCNEATQDVPGDFNHCGVAPLGVPDYTPFIVPLTATSMVFQLQYFANDGLDQVFLIQGTCPPDVCGEPDTRGLDPVPEPTSVVLLGSGLVLGARRLRKRLRG